jgi:Tol biopolymer transport system component
MAKLNHSLGALAAAAAGVLAAVGMLVLIMVALVEPAEAAFPGENGKIAFESSLFGDSLEICTFISRDAPMSRLTNNQDFDTAAAWSADGNKIAYARFDAGPEGEIYTMNANGAHQVQVTHNSTHDTEPSFSPDGDNIAYTGADVTHGDGEIYRINTDGGGKVQLTNNSTDDVQPSYSPNGKAIVYTGSIDGWPEIFTINADGGGKVQLTNNSARDFDPAWSPDGSRIAFTSTRDGNLEIYTMNANGTQLDRLTTNPNHGDTSPAWSPDGNKIAYASHDGNDREIFTINADGGRRSQLTNNDAYDQHPDWQPSPDPTPDADTFVNNNIIRIPADQISGGTFGKADPYPSTISVSGFKSLTDVNVTIRSATHTDPDDLDVLLVGPTGRTAILWSDAGGTSAITGTTLTLDDDAPVALPDSGQISAQTYMPSNYQVGEDNWPGITESGNRQLSTFDGTNPTGEWKLYVFDDTQQPDTGDRNGSGTFQGWALEIRGTR